MSNWIANIGIGNVKKPNTQRGTIVYVGRNNLTYRLAESPLHNPFRVGSPGYPTAGSTLTDFEHHLRRKIASGDAPVLKELRRIITLAMEGPVTLLCWCVPGPCHAQRIKAILPELEVSLSSEGRYK